jgi:aminopeptidase N
MLGGLAQDRLAVAEPGSGWQLTWARAFITAARTPEQAAVLRGWLGDGPKPEGLVVDTELRWSLLQALAAIGVAAESEIDDELAADKTASGEREAAIARALLPTPENKARVWAELTGPQALPNWLNRSLLQGFQSTRQVALTAPYAEKFFAAVDDVWARSDSEPAQEFATLAYPAFQISEETVALTDAWLAQDGHPASLRRLVAEGRDGILRAMRARAKDRSAS